MYIQTVPSYIIYTFDDIECGHILLTLSIIFDSDSAL